MIRNFKQADIKNNNKLCILSYTIINILFLINSKIL